MGVMTLKSSFIPQHWYIEGVSILFEHPVYKRDVKGVGSWIGDRMTSRSYVNYGTVNGAQNFTLSADSMLPPGVGGLWPTPTYTPPVTAISILLSGHKFQK